MKPGGLSRSLPPSVRAGFGAYVSPLTQTHPLARRQRHVHLHLPKSDWKLLSPVVAALTRLAKGPDVLPASKSDVQDDTLLASPP